MIRKLGCLLLCLKLAALAKILHLQVALGL